MLDCQYGRLYTMMIMWDSTEQMGFGVTKFCKVVENLKLHVMFLQDSTEYF